MKLLFPTALLFIACGFNAQSQINFQKVYTTATGGDVGYSVNKTTDGGYIATGRTGAYNLATSDVSLIKLDANGGLEWAKTFGGSDEDQGLAVQQTIDGGYIIAGNSKNSGNNLGDAYLIRTDPSGNLLWSKTYGGTYADMALSVQQTLDSGFIVCGYTTTDTIPAPGSVDLMIFKTDVAGVLVWGKHYGGVKNDIGYSIHPTPDGGYIATGVTSSFSNENPNVLLLKIDSIGNVLWSKTYGGSNYDVGFSVKHTVSGGYVIVGYTQSYTGNNVNQIYLIKTTDSGDLLWSKTYGGTNYSDAYDVYEAKDGGYTIAGRRAFNYWQFQPYIIKTDSTGHEEWAKSYGGAHAGMGYSILQCNDNGYLMIGDSQDTLHAATKISLIRTDSLGNTGCTDTGRFATETTVGAVETTIAILTGSWGIENNITTTTNNVGQIEDMCLPSAIANTSLEETNLKCYPNPGPGVFIFECQKTIQTIQVTDMLGSKVFTCNVNANKAIVNLSQLSNGVYFIPQPTRLVS